ncbi:sugar-binding domain-containing protein [Chitinophaga sp. 30R24]|uniref:sugar-binding domain-containing protein n=1 Tax=Chitinophaga sp. 30R24 TaxID=3248838 RepID=UPI003B920C2A
MNVKKNSSALLILLLSSNCYAQNGKNTTLNGTEISHYKMQPIHMPSRWAKEVGPDNALKEYPRPQMERKNWENLNGLWEYAITDSSIAFPTSFDGSILVPYPLESALSGVQKKLMPDQRLWYKRNIKAATLQRNERLILNFGAVDWQATLFVNNKAVTTHSGGYENFSADITDYLHAGPNEILIKVYDPSDRGPNPHGKQVLNPGNIYYTPSSGIWQTVWMEKVAATHINRIQTTPDIDKKLLDVQVSTTAIQPNMQLEVTASTKGKIVTTKKIPLTGNASLSLAIPNAHLWSPDDPFLYDLTVKLITGGKTTDEIKSYFGMRKIAIQKDEKGIDRIFLNNQFTYNLGTLDQGFWPEGLYTAPTDEALAFDIKAIKSLGFNTIRKHIKIEPERWYYHADKIGVLVWQDFVNPAQGLPAGAKEHFEKEVQATMDQLHNHPSIVTWVVFNERWGAYDQQRITEWVKHYDPSRIVNGHSGELLYVGDQLRAPAAAPWISSDMTDVHSYPDPRNPPTQPGKAKVVGEFGGIGVAVPGHEWNDMQGWGYVQIDPAQLKNQYALMVDSLKKLEALGLSGSIYTQPYDVEGEENGLLTYDREIIKMPVNEIREINKTLVAQTSGFSLDQHFYIAANMDVNDNDNRYTELLSQFKQGNRDSAFLRRLTLMAMRKKDQSNATLAGNTYIEALTDPYSKENLVFIRQITRTTKDKGFQMFISSPERVNNTLGEHPIEYDVRAIINKEDVAHYLTNNKTTANWDSLQQAMAAKYGSLGEEVILGEHMAYCEATNDWKNYGKYYVLYFKKAIKRSDYHINNKTWTLFEHVNDSAVLDFAAEVMKYDIQAFDGGSAEAYDTYANLLHKLNRSADAIKWEEKAVERKKGAPDEKEYTDNLQKMKAGQPTWPQNN